MEIVLYKPEIAGNVGACIRLSANTGLALNLIKPFGFSFQENKNQTSWVGLSRSSLGQCFWELE